MPTELRDEAHDTDTTKVLFGEPQVLSELIIGRNDLNSVVSLKPNQYE